MIEPAGGQQNPARRPDGEPDGVAAPGGELSREAVPGPAMVRLRLDLGYDGTDFSGWARQPGLRTVQGDLEAGLARVLRLDPAPTLTVAGRTDAGVHARGQVAHVDLPVEALRAVRSRRSLASRGTPEAPGEAADGPLGMAESLAALARRLGGVLSPDVRVHGVTEAPEGFDARFSALFRRYAYRVCDVPGGGDPLRRWETVWYPRTLDLDSMNAAASLLLGEHDFAAFCKKRDGATTIRELQRLRWERDGDGVLVATVIADAFCHSMVRALVGALLAVGEGRRPVEWPGEVLTKAVRDSRVNIAPAHGLCLAEVRYPDTPELARRAALTRRVRSLGGPPRTSGPLSP